MKNTQPDDPRNFSVQEDGSPEKDIQSENPAAEWEPPEEKKTEQETSAPESAIETDGYDQVPGLEGVSEEELSALAEKECVEVSYSFNGEDVREGLKIFQRATIFKKNLIYTLILAVIFILYLSRAVKTPNTTMSILSVLCVVVIALIWYMPAQHIRRVAAGADENQSLRFQMCIYDSCVQIAEEKGSFLLHYGKEINRTFETDHLFMVCAGKERIFILPKRHIEEEQIEAVRNLLKSGMRENHLDRRAKGPDPHSRRNQE